MPDTLSPNTLYCTRDNNKLILHLSDNNRGTVYTFKRIDGVWTQNNKFTAFDSAIGDNFDTCVNSNATGNIFAVSAINDDDKGTDSGAVYVYDHSNDS